MGAGPGKRTTTCASRVHPPSSAHQVLVRGMLVRGMQNEGGWNEPLLLPFILQHPGAPTAAPTGTTPKGPAALKGLNYSW